MSETPEIRVVEGDFEVRTQDGKRIIEGKAVPFDILANIGGAYYEQHRMGAFARTIGQGAKRLPLMSLHDYQTLPIGVSTRWVESQEERGLMGVWEMNDSALAQEVGERLDDGSMTGLSIGFKGITWDEDFESRGLPVVTRTENALKETSVVPVATWDEAEVLVRSGLTLHRPTPALDAAREWLEQTRRDSP